MIPPTEDPEPGQPTDESEPERLPPKQPARAKAGEAEEELPRMTLLEHLNELRRRILRTLIVVLVAFFACFAFAEEIYTLLAKRSRLTSISSPSTASRIRSLST